MSRTILAIRPEPGLSASVEAGHAMGLSISGHPLFEVRALAWEPPPSDAIDGLLLGSANPVRHAGPALDAFRGMPTFAVGEATAAAAEAAGLAIAAVGEGSLQPLLDTLAPPLRLLRLTGAEHVPLTPPPGIELVTRIAYAATPLPLPGALADVLREGALVLLHSAAAAHHFAGECDRLAVARKAVSLAALGPRIAAAAGGGWREVRSAHEPREAALLALARQMCHDPSGG